MRCTQAQPRLQLYLDGRLDVRQLTPLQEHIRQCAACRNELVLLEAVCEAVARQDPMGDAPDLAPRVMARIAALEAHRAAPASARAARGVRSWQGVAALITLVALWLIGRPGSQGLLTATMSRTASALVQTLLSPGPDSIAWAAWVVGAMTMLVLAFRFMRVEATSAWRALAQRLPQLW